MQHRRWFAFAGRTTEWWIHCAALSSPRRVFPWGIPSYLGKPANRSQPEAQGHVFSLANLLQNASNQQVFALPTSRTLHFSPQNKTKGEFLSVDRLIGLCKFQLVVIKSYWIFCLHVYRCFLYIKQRALLGSRKHLHLFLRGDSVSSWFWKRPSEHHVLLRG